MQIPELGVAAHEITATLERYRSGDTDWRAGKTWGYVFDAGREIEDVGKRAFVSFLSENALDPTVYPSLLRLENELVGMTLAHLRAPDGSAGIFSSGGTESIILAVKAAREALRERRPDVTQPELLLPVTAHAAFHKAAHYLGMRVVPVRVDPRTFTADVAHARELVSNATALIVGSAPSYAHGVIDPIAELAALAVERGVPCHVDGCIGGFLLPYFERLGRELPRFDFRVPGVTSISMDLHKYGYAPKGASVVLFRDKALRRQAMFACSRWSGYTLVNTTIQSTKSGGPLAGAWAVLNHVGDSGYLEIARKLAGAMDALVSGIREIPELRLLGDPRMTLLACASDEISVFVLCDEMKTRGWYIQPQLGVGTEPSSFHLSLNPSNVVNVPAFLSDLGAAVQSAKRLGKPELPAPLLESLASLDPAALSPETFRQMLAMVGLDGFVVPERMAEVNHLLAALSPALRERVLTEFVNELFSPA
jgi:glutamate/tyrosine decarboxylase-like PLP-dependent enzyme